MNYAYLPAFLISSGAVVFMITWLGDARRSGTEVLWVCLMALNLILAILFGFMVFGEVVG